MSIESKNPQYTAHIDNWNLVNDICDAKNLNTYLVQLNPDDLSAKNKTRNSQFFKRAVFSAVTGYTAKGFLGKAFSKRPELNIPDDLYDAVTKNIDGIGTSIYQQSQEVMRDVIRIGRAGLLVDFPPVDGDTSRADMNSQEVFATITRYNASQIINWKTEKIGAALKPTLIVLTSSYSEKGKDEFETIIGDICIELRLEEGIYVQREWRKTADTSQWYVWSEVIPRNSRGETLDYIPFVFVGSEANTYQIDFLPMYNLAKLNVGHFNNSAIYEDSVFTVGQVQPWMSGLNQETMELMDSNNMYVGSGRLLGVPSGEKFDFAQAGENMLAREAMKDKVEMMIGLGAMFMSQNNQAKTATQVDGELMAQHSILSIIAHNVSEGYNDALAILAEFMGSDTGDIYYQINQDFIDPKADANMLNAVVASFLQGVLPMSDLYSWQKRHGLIDTEKTLEEYQDEIGEQPDMVDIEEE